MATIASPSSLAFSVRLVSNQAQQAIVTYQNAGAAANYTQKVYQLYTWPKYYEQAPNGPPPVIPDPPLMWKAVELPLTDYDRQMNLPAEIVAVEGPEKFSVYVDPGPATKAVVVPGVADFAGEGHNGEWVVGPKDTMPTGIPLHAPDGSWVQKVCQQVGSFGTACWYAPIK